MRRPVKTYTMWCIQTPRGKLLLDTISTSRSETLFALFDSMSESFRQKHWKNIRSSNAAYKKLGYVAIQVDIVPVKPFA